MSAATASPAEMIAVIAAPRVSAGTSACWPGNVPTLLITHVSASTAQLDTAPRNDRRPKCRVMARKTIHKPRRPRTRAGSAPDVESRHDAHARAGFRRRDREVERDVERAGTHRHAGGRDQPHPERGDVR